VSQIMALKASMCAEEARYRGALERVQSVAVRYQGAGQRVAESTASLWSEVVRRKVAHTDNPTAGILRERITGGAGEALKRLGRELQNRDEVSTELAQQSLLVASLSNGLAARGVVLERLERRAALRRENQGQEEIDELATLASLAQGDGVLPCNAGEVAQLLGPPASASGYVVVGEDAPRWSSGPHSASITTDAPLYTVGVERMSDPMCSGIDTQASQATVSLTLTDPAQKTATARVQVTTERSGALVAEVTVTSSPLSERVVDHKALICRKLAELDLSLANLTVSHGDLSSDGRQNRRSIKVRRSQEEGDDEVCIS
jgi:hypothetical protein